METIVNIRKLLFEDLESQIQNLKTKYVGPDKPISEEDFKKIQEITNNKFYTLSWLTKKVGTGIIKAEDVYKYKEYFDIFEKNKNKFEHKDLNLYKTKEDLQKFLETIFSIREKDVEFEDIKGQDNYVSQSDIEKLTSTGGIKYLGMWNTYQVFRIHKSNEKTWKKYRDILGRCSGRGRGAKIDICTIGDYDYFQNYLKEHRLSNYFLLFNLNDPKSPYQLHHESRQFMDKNDRPVEDKMSLNYVDFYKFIAEKFPKYGLEKLVKYTEDEDSLLLPVAGKGWIDENGKQGEWETFGNGYKEAIHTYKDNKLYGPFTLYQSDGEIQTKGTMRNGTTVGDYIDYTLMNNIRSQGKYNSRGNRVGIWTFNLGEASTTDYMKMEIGKLELSGYTGDGTLRYLGTSKYADYPEKYGPFIFFHTNGKIAAKGKLIGDRPSGEWKYYNKKGELIAKGRWARGEKNGPWIDTIVKNGRKFTLKSVYSNGTPSLIYPKVEVYDAKGDFLYSGKAKNIYKTLGIDLNKVAEHHYISTMD